MKANKLLQVNDLTIQIDSMGERFYPVDRVSFAIEQGKTTALVGESGSGKTLTALSLLDLLPKNSQCTRGEIYFKNSDLLRKQNSWHKLRGSSITMIFQDALASLNPAFRIGYQISDVIQTHLGLSAQQIKRNLLELFEQVGFVEPQRIYRSYPHQLSGGMAQRVMITMAICCNPDLVIADEPVTALDIVTQNQILKLLATLQQQKGFSLLLISHDMNVVAQLANQVFVMKNGRVIEHGDTEKLIAAPHHSYTKQLMDSIITPDKIRREVCSDIR